MKLCTIQKGDTTRIAQIPREQVRLLWSDDWYDGPISGMAEFNGASYLFDLIDRDQLGAEQEVRAYWLIQLSDVQLNDEVQWHELFCQKVGTHFDFTGRPPLAREQVDMDAFYEPYGRRIPPDYRDNLVIGWFRL